jgi:signal transduction histidine kinase
MLRPSIRRKLAAALAVPLAALVTLTVLEVARTARAADEVRAQTELAKAAIGPSGVITALQNERAWLGVALVGQEDAVNPPVRGTEATRAQTDAAIEAFHNEISHRDDVVRDAFQAAMRGLGELRDIRAHFDAEPGPRDLSNIGAVDDVFARYTALIEPFFEGSTRVALVIDDAELRQGAELADIVARQSEVFAVVVEKTISLATSSPGGVDTPEEISGIARLQSDLRRYAATLREPAGPYAEFASEHFPEDQTRRVDEQIDAAMATGRIDLPELEDAVNVPEDEAYTGYMLALHQKINRRADELLAVAEARQLWFSVLAGLALAGAVALTVLVSRSITRPLRSLTQQAKEMAEFRLPEAVLHILETPLGDDVHVPRMEPVTVRTRDEVSDVAEALNTVQDSALDLAVEQAVLRRNIADSFVNLGRRNQNLLGRQLDFITELESNETNPDTLASLFRLDHLATRMRRNAESLLVLAGIEPPRKWVAPVRLTEIVRAALGEVEDYHRVSTYGVEPTMVVGTAAADLAHLIAELLENALTFSPPDQRVQIRGRRSQQRDGYELAIIDSGLGMAPTDLERANSRLAGTESFTVAPSKYLGHYVAGNLAARHGIAIRLGPTPGRGITASIELPPHMLTAPDAAAGVSEAQQHRALGEALPPDTASAPPSRHAPSAADARANRAPGPPTGPGWALGPGARPSSAIPTDDLLAVLGRRATGQHADQARGHDPAGLPDMSAQVDPLAPARTARGLARRIPGAQIPAAEPVPLHRGTTARRAEPVPTSQPSADEPASGPRHRRRGIDASAAQDVYGFLTDFAAGRQRGLDESRGAAD